jgi:putative two-component system response regulator
MANKVFSLSQDANEVLHASLIAAFALSTLAEQREAASESHIRRVQRYVQALAVRLQSNPAFATVLTDSYIELLCLTVPLYDMGTIGVPDRILLKPGHLTPEETAIMRTHTTLGYEAIVRAEKTLGSASPYLTVAKEITLSHQEKWDGSGYPQGLAGAQIPLSARLVALADVYDALISSKVYKPGVPHDKAVQVIFGERGAHFDPDLVDAFIEIQDEFAAIATRFADTEADMAHKIEYMANAIAETTEI